MSIFRLEVVSHSRKDGTRIAARAAYRAAARLVDHGTGEVYDYTRKRGVVHTELMLPASAPSEFRDRETLWNAVEEAERRRDSKLAREVLLSLPYELSRSKQVELARSFSDSLCFEFEIAVDIAIHEPESKWSDSRNVHAHLLCSTRRLDNEGFGLKTVELDRSRTASIIVESWREKWAEMVNQALLEAGIDETVDHRSYAKQGILREPQPKIGAKALALERQGIRTDKGEKWREWKQRQKQMEALEMELQQIGSDEQELEQGTGGDSLSQFPGILIPDDEQGKRKQAAKLRILEEEYQNKIRNYSFVDDLKYVKKGRKRLDIWVDSGGKLIDLGDRIIADRMSDKVAAEHLATLAEAKGWRDSGVALTGSEAFKREAWLALKARGIEVVNYQPSADLLARWEKMQNQDNISPISQDNSKTAEAVHEWRSNREPPPEEEETPSKRRRPRP